VDAFAWVDWQGARAIRAFFEYLVMAGDRAANRVPCPRRGQEPRSAAHRTDSHGYCPQNRLTCAKSRHNRFP
jgi:hypothetical protein